MAPHRTLPPRRGQRGLTLVEFMVSIAIGMLMVAALATLIADQSQNRAEIDKAGRLIENGRYAIRAMADEIQMAGYWGELSAAPAAPGALPDPCSVTVADLTAAMGLHVQGYTPNNTTSAAGYNPTSPTTTAAPTCLSNHKLGTDILVVRRVDPDSSMYETGGVTDTGKLTSGNNKYLVYLQSGLTATGTAFTSALGMGQDHATTFTLKKKDRTTMATVRKMIVRIYYVTSCSVCTGTPDTTPTLKMRELSSASTGTVLADAITLSEGVENLQVDYGVDTDSDGVPDSDVNGGALAVADWANVMSVKIHLLVRSPEATAGYTDAKTYTLGTAGTTAATSDGFKRHVFSQSVRLVNPSGRRLP
ncbi:MAG TPA: PilW family protein [Ramlibacter sp.]|nr:PilW family protein [Ramlibacter sp.]